MFDSCWILSDQPLLEVMDDLVDGFVGADTIRLADSVQMLVGEHLHKNVVAGKIDRVRQNVDDFHAKTPARPQFICTGRN